MGHQFCRYFHNYKKNVSSLQSGFGFTNQFQILWIEPRRTPNAQSKWNGLTIPINIQDFGGYKVLITFMFGLSDISHPRKYFLPSK
jgi:hypothetical protein